MPWKTLLDLPASIKEYLPRHAQEIYLAAFNHAWDEYKNPKSRRGKALPGRSGVQGGLGDG